MVCPFAATAQRLAGVDWLRAAGDLFVQRNDCRNIAFGVESATAKRSRRRRQSRHRPTRFANFRKGSTSAERASRYLGRQKQRTRIRGCVDSAVPDLVR